MHDKWHFYTRCVEKYVNKNASKSVSTPGLVATSSMIDSSMQCVNNKNIYEEEFFDVPFVINVFYASVLKGFKSSSS